MGKSIYIWHYWSEDVSFVEIRIKAEKEEMRGFGGVREEVQYTRISRLSMRTPPPQHDGKNGKSTPANYIIFSYRGVMDIAIGEVMMARPRTSRRGFALL